MKITLDPKLTGDPEYIATNATGRGVWLQLLLWCAEQENGGIILDAANWSEEAWGMLGVSKNLLAHASRLVAFTSRDMVLRGYPIQQEELVARRRRAACANGNKSKGRPRKPTLVNTSVNTSVPMLVFPEILDTPEFHSAWESWVEYRRTRKLAAYKPQSLDKQLAELSDWGHDEAIRSINDSIRQQWQGLFPPKNSAASGRKASFA